MIVVDASAVLAFLIQSPAAARIDEYLFGGETHAPHLIDLEVMHAIRRWVLSGAMTRQDAENAIEYFKLMRIHRSSHEALLDRIWRLRDNLTAYDAAYVALAEVLDTVVITTDAKLAAAPGMSRRVKLVS
ncbi:MAG TPA: type II toxin-antitoxin system VapC family toxin [Thermoanaerobaculia bacterium]|nr:type II toxin-antitoxin system VapC family toxin [Thermoanaerobaculia bacterium]